MSGNEGYFNDLLNIGLCYLRLEEEQKALGSAQGPFSPSCKKVNTCEDSV
jgi:hypothetical protein